MQTLVMLLLPLRLADVFRLTLALEPVPRLGEQAKMGSRLGIEVVIVELAVFALYVDGTEVDRPIIGLVHGNADTPIVEGKVGSELLLADDHTKDRRSPRPVFTPPLMFARKMHERQADGQAEWVTVPPDAKPQDAMAKDNTERPAADLPLKLFLR